MKRALAFLVLFLGGSVLAQESPSYKITNHAFNSGGDLLLTSPSYQVTMTSLGEGMVGGGLTSSSYRMNASFAGCYPPPGEVANLHFTDAVTFTWDADLSAGVYSVYRGEVSVPFDPSYGICMPPSGSSTTRTDTDTSLSSGEAFFYLVTANNLLDEEGTKGSDSTGTERANPVPCP